MRGDSSAELTSSRRSFLNALSQFGEPTRVISRMRSRESRHCRSKQRDDRSPRRAANLPKMWPQHSQHGARKPDPREALHQKGSVASKVGRLTQKVVVTGAADGRENDCQRLV